MNNFNDAKRTLTIAEMPARVGWRIISSDITFSDPPERAMLSISDFPGYSTAVPDGEIVWDVFTLIDSVQRPGAYQLLTCACGYAPDASLNEMLQVSHPDAGTVVWELDVRGLRPALDARFASAGDGFVRLVFQRDACEADISAMLRDCKIMPKHRAQSKLWKMSMA